MTAPHLRWDVACFSYLAHAHVLHVSSYPQANHGAQVKRTFTSLAGDGPITAALCASAGLRVALVTNQLGQDAPGSLVRRELETAGVHQVPAPGTALRSTPYLTVVTDDADTRTWFADLSGAYASLHQADTTALGRARLAYVDGYTLIADAAAAAISAASEGGVPLLLNLGSDPLDSKIEHAARTSRVYAVQTGLSEPRMHEAAALGRDLLARLQPAVAVITLGALGAIAFTRTSEHRIPARTVDVVHTHGAGAAFSAGLVQAHLAGRDIPAAVRAACAAGTAHCTAIPSATTARSAS